MRSGYATRVSVNRSVPGSIGISTLLAVLVYRYYSLQITNDDFLTQSDRNHVRVEVIPPPRGQLSTGRSGARGNKPTFVVGVILERSEDSEALIDTLANVCR